MQNELDKGTLKEDLDFDLAIYENLVFGEAELSGDDDTASSSQDSDSEKEEDDEDSTTDSNMKTEENQEVVQLQYATASSDCEKVSSAFLDVEKDETKKSRGLNVVAEPSTEPSTGLIQELNWIDTYIVCMGDVSKSHLDNVILGLCRNLFYISGIHYLFLFGKSPLFQIC